MAASDLPYTSAAELARMIRAKEISATEGMRATLERAQEVQAACNCFITICAEQPLAAGVCPIGVGSDGGGSTRIPGACNGIVGLKQSAGVSPHDMSPEVFANVSSINPMARTVMDTALMLEAMAGQHASDPYSYGAPSNGFVAAARPEGSLKGMRI